MLSVKLTRIMPARLERLDRLDLQGREDEREGEPYIVDISIDIASSDEEEDDEASTSGGSADGDEGADGNARSFVDCAPLPPAPSLPSALSALPVLLLESPPMLNLQAGQLEFLFSQVSTHSG